MKLSKLIDKLETRLMMYGDVDVEISQDDNLGGWVKTRDFDVMVYEDVDKETVTVNIESINERFVDVE